jgi:hypothetical protein
MKDKRKDKPVEPRRPLTDGKVKDTNTGYVYEPVTVPRDEFPADLPNNRGF